MSALLIDTSSWVSYFAGRGSTAVEEALEDGRVLLSPIVAAELASGRMTQRRRAELEDLLADLPLLSPDLGHWLRVGRLRAELAAKGLQVSTPDAHLAQAALDEGATLLSEDAIFGLVAQRTGLRLHPG